MSPTGAQEEMEEVQTDLRKKEEEVTSYNENLRVFLKLRAIFCSLKNKAFLVILKQVQRSLKRPVHGLCYLGFSCKLLL